MEKFLKFAIVILPLFVFVFFAFSAHADTGTIPSSIDCSENESCAQIMQDDSFINFGCSNCDVTVTDDYLTGYAWGENVGWINLNCEENGGSNCGNSGNFKVANDGNGELSGYAWGQNTGWINFNCVENGGSNCANSGNFKVVINDDGEFEGHAWSQNYGYIEFACPGVSCVTTDWSASSGSSGSGGFGGGGEGEGNTDDTDNTTDTTDDTDDTDDTTTDNTDDTTDTIDNTDDTVDDTTDDTTDNTTDSSGEGNGNGGGGGFDIVEFVSSFLPIPAVNNFIERSIYPITLEQLDKGLKIAAIASVAVGAVVSLATTLFLNPLSAPELVLIPLRIWSLLLTALGLKKRTQPWGTVYDAVTKQPLDPVYVSLVNLKGEEVASSITDIDGRFGFFAEPGVYKVVPNKTNYVFPSATLAKHFKDEFYQDLYFGDYINVGAGEIIVKNIPMDPVNFDWNEFAKNKKSLFHFYSQKELKLARISNVLFGFGFSVATIALIVSPEIYNIIIFALYVGMYILRKTSFTLKAKGRVLDKDGSPLAFGFVRVCSISTNVEIAHKVTDNMGRYHMLLPNGTYYAKIEKKNDDGSYSLVHTSGEIKVVHGTLNKVFNI